MDSCLSRGSEGREDVWYDRQYRSQGELNSFQRFVFELRLTCLALYRTLPVDHFHRTTTTCPTSTRPGLVSKLSNLSSSEFEVRGLPSLSVTSGPSRSRCPLALLSRLAFYLSTILSPRVTRANPVESDSVHLCIEASNYDSLASRYRSET